MRLGPVGLCQYRGPFRHRHPVPAKPRIRHQSKGRLTYLVFEKLAELDMRATGLVRALDEAAPTVAICLTGGIDYVVADLAITLSGQRQVPIDGPLPAKPRWG